jgi:two-component system, LytTR family, response regulator
LSTAIINCIIVEDEPLAAERLRQYVLRIPFLNLAAVFDNGVDAMMYLKQHEVGLIFLDINLGEMTGIELLESINLSAQVVMITAYQEHALKGFELNVTDYLLKPYTFARFFQAAERVQQNTLKAVTRNDVKFIFIKTEYRLEKILLDDILYIEGMRDYRQIHLINKKIMTLQTFTEMEQQIPPTAICRIHRSYMVSISKIDSIERDRIRIKDTLLPVSDTYKKQFMNIIDRANGAM